MKRAHRRVHRLVWILLPPVIAVILLLAWQAREHQPIPTAITFGGEW